MAVEHECLKDPLPYIVEVYKDNHLNLKRKQPGNKIWGATKLHLAEMIGKFDK